MTDSALILAIDGGGTGTRVRLLSAQGKQLASATSGPSSLTLGIAQAWSNIQAATCEAYAKTNQDLTTNPPALLACGLAGIGNPVREEEFHASTPFENSEILLVNDGYASLYGAFAGKPGTTLAIGTGIAAYSLNTHNQVHTVSGWGLMVGDEGSGAWIGKKAMQAYTHHLDGRISVSSKVFEHLSQQVGAHRPAVLRWIVSATPTQFASLAPMVIAEAKQNDPLAN